MKHERNLIHLYLCTVLLLAASAQAQFNWARRVASAAGSGRNIAIGMAIDNSTNLYVTGWFDGTNDFGGVSLTNGSGGGEGIFVGKYNRFGALQWVQKVSGSPGVDGEENAGRGVGVDAAGNVYLTGELFCPASFGTTNVTATSSGSCFFLAKCNSSGVVKWVRLNACPPSSFCTGDGLAVDAAGNSYVVGGFDGNTIAFGATTLTNASPGNASRFLVKYNASGAVQWAVGILSTDQTLANSVSLDTNGNAYVTGRFLSDLTIDNTHFTGSGAWNGFVAKVSNTGDVQWARQITSASGVQPMGVHADNLGNVYISGGFGTVAGTTASFGSSITLTNQGGGSVGSSEGDGIGDAFVAKYDAATGAVQWARVAGGTGEDAYFGATTDPHGNVYAAGGFMSGGDVGSISVPAGSGWTVVAAKYSPAGMAQWVQSVEGTGMVFAFTPVVGAGGTCYISGLYQGSVTFGTNVLQSQGTWNFFLAEATTATGPSIQFTADVTNGRTPLTVQFNCPNIDSLGNSIVGWNWNFDDGAGSTEQSPSHTYTTVGSFAPTLIATNSKGQAIIATGSRIIVLSPPTLHISASPTNGTAPLTVQFNSPGVDSLGNPIVSWKWNFGDGGTSTNQNPSHTYRSVGAFTAFLVAIDVMGVEVFASGPSISLDYQFRTLHSFSSRPEANLVLSGNSLYGATDAGAGAIFRINTDGSGFTVLYNFAEGGRNPIYNFGTNHDGSSPNSLVLSGNMLYGTAFNSGPYGGGTIFSLSTNGSGFTTLHNFKLFTLLGSDGDGPDGLTLSGNMLYGTTWLGGPNYGEVIAINTNGGDFNILHGFSGPDGADGAKPYGGVIVSGSTLYGTTSAEGANGNGTLFRAGTDGTHFAVLHTFSATPRGTNSDGALPRAGLILCGNTLYGTTRQGGAAGNGTVFGINTDGGGFTNLHNFSAAADYGDYAPDGEYVLTNSDGALPVAGLTCSGSTLYGTTGAGGAYGCGTVFSLDTNGTGFSLLHSFTGGSGGGYPYADLVVSGDMLYGMTGYGGAYDGYNSGTLFSLSLASGNTSSPPLVIAEVSVSGTSIVLNGINGRSALTNYVLMSTNIDLPLSYWTRVATNVLSASGNFTIIVTNGVAQDVKQRFYFLQTP